MEKIGLEAVLNMANFNKGMSQYTKGVAAMEGETGKAAGMMGRFDGIVGKIQGGVSSLVPAIAGATAALYTMKKAFDFGKEGAVIAQTKESFDRLIDSMGAASDTLSRMRVATNNTVDDMTLMSSTLTLVAGASDELGRSMIDAAPQLLEIAKAANKLNPALGDTAFLYNSLALGVKRASPLVLDNLGLTIKIGEANQRWADRMGITVEQMSATDKQMALLEETLRAGDIMIQQVGGDTESMADSFARAETQIKNATDTIKMETAPAIAEATKLFADFLTVISGNNFEQMERAAGGAGEGLLDMASAAEQAKGEMKKASIAGGLQFGLVGVLVSLFHQSKLTADELLKLADAADATWQEVEKVADALDITIDEQDKHEYITEQNIKTAKKWAAELEVVTANAGDLADALEEVTVESSDMEKVQRALEAAIDEVQKRYESFMRSLSTGIIKLRDLGDESQKSSQRYKEALQDLAREGTKSLREVQDGFEASLPDATTVAERMGMAEDAWDEWGLRIQDIIENGVESPWYAVLQDMGYSKPPDVGMREWAEDLKQQFYAGQLPDLLPPEWAENVRAQQEEATSIVRAENAKRRAEIEAARQAELEAERQARNQATLELALTLAEQRGQLQAWSQEKFGPDFSQVADSASEVLGLLEAGMLDIDAVLQGIIEDNSAGVQAALDTTGGLAEENQRILDELVERDYSSELARNMGLEGLGIQIRDDMGNTYDFIEDEMPETPFDPLLANFDGVSEDIFTNTMALKLNLGGEFNEIDQLWQAMVLEQVTSWDEGMTEVERTIQEKVIDKLEEIPKKIIITVETEQEGGEGRQHGGPVTAGVPYVVGEAGPELFIPDTAGQVMPNDWTMNLPALTGAGGGGGATQAGPVVQVTMNPTINTPMDLAEFEMMTERTVQRAIRGY